MNETWDSQNFSNESVVPAQIFAGRADDGRIEPLKKLAFAVLVDAVHVFQLNFASSQHRARRQFEEARQWLLGAPGQGPFCFENICYLLGVDPSALRSSLLQWQTRKRAGQPPRIWARRSPVKPSASLRPGSPCRGKSTGARGNTRVVSGATVTTR